MKSEVNSFRFAARSGNPAAGDVRRDLAEALGTDDAELVEGFRLLGFDGGTVEAFSLLPLVYVAWAEGSVSGPERRRVLEVARHRDLREGTPAHDLLLGWLEERPEEGLFKGALRLIRRTLDTTADGRKGARVNSLIADCIRIAEASGGVRGFVGGGDNVCAEEMEVLRRIARHLAT
jgi:hypothetical protein